MHLKIDMVLKECCPNSNVKKEVPLKQWKSKKKLNMPKNVIYI